MADKPSIVKRIPMKGPAMNYGGGPKLHNKPAASRPPGDVGRRAQTAYDLGKANRDLPGRAMSGELMNEMSSRITKTPAAKTIHRSMRRSMRSRR